MNIDDFSDSLMGLMHDAATADRLLKANPKDQFIRRTFVRSLFAFVEG